MLSPKISLEEAHHYLKQLDLSYIVVIMCSEDYFLPRWTLSDAAHCAELYKEYLYLIKKHWPEALVPTREIDEFWHNHILYTKKYTHDCTQIFGHYLHHDLASPSEDKNKLVSDYLRTKALYFAEYQRPLDLIVGK